MEKCCPNPYNNCEQWLGCFWDLAIRIPDSFPDPVVTLRFQKWVGKQVAAKTNAIIAGGWAVIDLDALPKAFLNSYTVGYTIEFLDASGVPFPFVAKDGKTYLAASFNITPTASVDEIGQLNFIDTETYP